MSISESLKSIKNKISCIKDNVLAAYDAIADKGGEVPSEKTMENLPAAISSMPSGLFGQLEEIGWLQENVDELNAKRDEDIAYSKSVAHLDKHSGDKKLVYAPYPPSTNTTLVTFLNGATNVRYIPKIDCSKYRDSQCFNDAFRAIKEDHDIYLYNIDIVDGGNYVMAAICYGSSGLRSFTALGNLSFNIIGHPFYGCTRLKTMVLGDYSAATTMDFFSSSGYNGPVDLENFSVEKLPNVNMSNAFLRQTKLTHDSLMNIINALPTSTEGFTCTLGSTNLAKLTDEEKAIAIDKGWTLN